MAGPDSSLREESRSNDPSLAWSVFLVASAAFYTPLSVWVDNPEGPIGRTAIFVAVATMSFGLGVRWLAIRFGFDALGSTYAVFIGLLLATTTGVLLYGFTFGRWGLIVLSALAVLLIYRLRGQRLVRFLVTAAAFFFVLSPLANAISSSVEGSDTTEIAIGDVSATVEGQGDIVVLISDAYPSTSVLADFYEFDNGEYVADLEALGFRAGDISSNYSLTPLSVSSLLEMRLVVEEARLSRADVDQLYRALGGTNAFASTLKSSGYKTVLVESGWLGTSCGEMVDVCVSAPWPDETLYDIMFHSIVRDLPGFITGTSFTRGSTSTMAWANTELSTYLANDEMEYIHLHLLAPHAPFFFNPDCSLRMDPQLGGFGMNVPRLGVDNTKRRAGYLDQVQCVNRFVLEVADMVRRAGAIMVFVGDHGPDGENQFYTDGDEWTRDQISERFGTFAATLIDDCDENLPRTLVDVLPTVLNCIGADLDANRQPRGFVVGSEEGNVRTYEIALSVD